jgi:uncharacterized protein (DUF4415 family)
MKRYTAEQLDALAARGEDRTDWAKADAISQDEIERLADSEEGALPIDWEKSVVMGLPPGKDAVKLRIDRDVLAWFRGSGKGYQTRINTVLRAFMKARQGAPRNKRKAG